MKRLIIILLILLVSFALVSCSDSKNDITDVWDGTIATEFSKGDGTKDSPFVIETGAQLALMAKEVNSGNYADAHFVMGNNINLNGIEWTPIGNGEHPFSGSFDGNEKSITNLNVTKAIKFLVEYEAGAVEYGVAGLFGVCDALKIQNLTVLNASVCGEMIGSGNILAMGILSGYLKNEDNQNNGCSFYNVKINNSKVFIPNNSNEGGMVAIGGIAGYSSSSCNLERVEVSVTLDTSDRFINSNYNGGLIGTVTGGGVKCIDASVYTAVICPSLELLYGTNYAGAFGHLNPYEGNIHLKNVFSKIETNEKNYINSVAESPARIINSIAGAIRASDITAVEFENLFGCVVPINGGSELKDNNYELYTLLRDINCKETNCLGSDVLPDDHGFDTKIWDVSDKNKPFIK